MSLRQSPAAKPMSPNLAFSSSGTMLQSLANAAPMKAEATRRARVTCFILVKLKSGFPC